MIPALQSLLSKLDNLLQADGDHRCYMFNGIEMKVGFQTFWTNMHICSDGRFEISSMQCHLKTSEPLTFSPPISGQVKSVKYRNPRVLGPSKTVKGIPDELARSKLSGTWILDATIKMVATLEEHAVYTLELDVFEATMHWDKIKEHFKGVTG